MACPKCKGFMVISDVYTEQGNIPMWGCLHCGLHFDGVFLHNQRSGVTTAELRRQPMKGRA